MLFKVLLRSDILTPRHWLIIVKCELNQQWYHHLHHNNRMQHYTTLLLVTLLKSPFSGGVHPPVASNGTEFPAVYTLYTVYHWAKGMQHNSGSFSTCSSIPPPPYPPLPTPPIKPPNTTIPSSQFASPNLHNLFFSHNIPPNLQRIAPGVILGH